LKTKTRLIYVKKDFIRSFPTEEYGPPIINSKTILAAKLVSKIYEKDGTGGKGHIVFDDWNLEDDNVLWCLKNCKKHGGKFGLGKVQLELERKTLETFLELTISERASALAITEGIIEVPKWQKILVEGLKKEI